MAGEYYGFVLLNLTKSVVVRSSLENVILKQTNRHFSFTAFLKLLAHLQTETNQ